MSKTDRDILNKGGRPKVEDGRTKLIGGRFTEMEVQQINKMAKLYNLSKTDLLRSKLLDNIEPSIINGAEFTNELRTIGTELAHIGNNINQLAKHANSLDKIGAMNDSVISRFNILMNNHNREIKELNILLRNITRISSKSLRNGS